MQRESANRITECNKCRAEIFFAKNNNGKWMPFNLELSESIPPNTMYCDGYDKVKFSGAKGAKKGYLVHFETCGKGKKE